MKCPKRTWVIPGALLLFPVIAVAAQMGSEKQAIMEEIVVTGTASGGEVKKLNASFAITNASSEDIRRYSPKSTADMLKVVPGVWVESSGGVAGANVFVRGFPGGGDAPFLTVEMEGAPIYPPPTLSFLENTTLFRIDDTVQRMEGLRGGPQSVQDNGQPGLTTNFILKRGGDQTEGDVKYSTSDYDLQRFDAVVSGPLGDDLYYMVGGYVTSSPGIRDAGYSAVKGDQFTAKITKDLDNGTLSVYTRRTNDHGTWYLPAALNVPGVDNEYTQVGTLNRKGTIVYGAANKEMSVDLADGRGWDGTVSGVNFDLTVNSTWSMSDALNFTTGEADTVGLVPNGGADNVGALLADPNVDTSAVVTGTITGQATGRTIGSSEYIQQFGLWVVRKAIRSLTNNLALTGSFDQFDLTLGYYAATSSVGEFWALGNDRYYVVQQGGERVTGIQCNDATAVPDGCGFNYDIDADGDATSNALYAVGTWHASDVLDINLGVRSEKEKVNYSVDEGLVGVVDKTVDYETTKSSFTLGANYDIAENQGVFVRVSRGYKFPYFDDFRDNYASFTGGNDLTKQVTQYELGYKAAFANLSAYLTLFGNKVKGDTFVAFPGGPVETFTNTAQGVEVDAHWFYQNLTVGINATLQHTKITNDPANEGNRTQRQPKYQVRLTPGYDFNLGNGMTATVYGGLSFIGSRFSDNGNTVTLPSYHKLDLGIIFYASNNLSFQLTGDNLTNEEGLTEGDPRNPGAPNGRFIMPRSVKFTVGYDL